MIKHVGLHNAQNIFVVLHKMPMEDHMSLVLYTEKLPPAYSQAVIKCLNSPEGQSAADLALVLEKTLLPDGRNLGHVLYTEGHFKKVPSNQVFVTPDKVNKLRLSDLNEYLSKINEGGDALKKLEDLDKNKGMNRRKRGETTDLAESVQTQAKGLSEYAADHSPAPLAAVVAPERIDSASTSVTLKEQSAKLLQVAELLIKEAKALGEKADALLPAKTVVKKPRKKTTVAV